MIHNSDLAGNITECPLINGDQSQCFSGNVDRPDKLQSIVCNGWRLQPVEVMTVTTAKLQGDADDRPEGDYR
jgi:hypothetical protein